jgi:hypothetical protein
MYGILDKIGKTNKSVRFTPEALVETSPTSLECLKSMYVGQLDVGMVNTVINLVLQPAFGSCPPGEYVSLSQPARLTWIPAS